MLFKELIKVLKEGDSGVQEYNLASNPEITKAASLDIAQKQQISFIEKNSYLQNELINTKASALIIPQDNELIDFLNKSQCAWIKVKEPRLAFAEALEILNPKAHLKEGIHPSAVIGNNVAIGQGVHIGANVYIGDRTKIGKETIIHPGVVIYDEVIIGSENELHANCVIHCRSVIGNYCVINSNAVIGSEGFGFIPTKTGWRKMPQTGLVKLEDSVEIGACSTVDRPSVGETVIGKGTKIDNLVQIGHGVKTGEGCAMAAQVGIAGGAKIGNRVILAGQVGVGNRVKVGDGVIASSKCGVHADIEPGSIVSGFPAIPNKLWLRCSATFKKLPEIAKSIKNGSLKKST